MSNVYGNDVFHERGLTPYFEEGTFPYFDLIANIGLIPFYALAIVFTYLVGLCLRGKAKESFNANFKYAFLIRVFLIFYLPLSLMSLVNIKNTGYIKAISKLSFSISIILGIFLTISSLLIAFLLLKYKNKLSN